MFKSLNLFDNLPAAIGIDWLQLYVEMPLDDIAENTYYDVSLQKTNCI